MSLVIHNQSPLTITATPSQVRLGQFVQWTIYATGDGLRIYNASGSNGPYTLIPNGGSLSADNHRESFVGNEIWLRSDGGANVTVYISGIERVK